MHHLKRQHGVAQLLVVGLLALILVVIGLAVWQSQRAKQSADTTTTSPSSVATPSPTASSAADPYAGWLTYKSSADGAMLRYPRDWKILSNTPAQVDLAPTNGGESFRVVLRFLNNPATQYDKSGCSNVQILSSIDISGLGAKQLVAYGSTGRVTHLALTDTPANVIGQEAGCAAVFTSKLGNSHYVDISAFYGSGAEGAQSFVLGDFVQRSDVLVAKKILLSTAY